MPKVVNLNSKLGNHIQNLDFESVKFGYFHCKKVVYVGKIFPRALEEKARK